MAENPLVGQFDSSAVALVADVLRQALRPIRTRLINRVGADVPMAVGRCEFKQLGSLYEHLYEQEVRLLARVRMHPSGVPFVFGLDTPLLFRLMGLLMGEDPWGEPAAIDNRPLTGTDIRVARRILEDLVGGLQEGLPQLSVQRLVIEEVTDDPRLDLGLSASTGMFDATLEIGDPENPLGTAILGWPTSVVPQLYPDLPESVAEGRRERGEARVLPIRVDAVAELARVRMPLSRLEQIGVGDVLPLGRVREVQVRVRDRVALVAEPGVVEGVRCVRVLRNVHDLEAAS